MAIQIILALGLGVLILLLSILKLWNPNENCMEHVIKLPLNIEFKGCSIWGVILIVGLFVFYLGFDAANNTGADSEAPSTVTSISIFPKAYAGEGYCEQGGSGWVYMGDKQYNERWWFTKEDGDVGKADGKISGILIMKAESDRYLREESFEALTGTTLGKILGVKTPKPVCIVKKGSRVKVVEFKQVGRNRAWANAIVQ